MGVRNLLHINKVQDFADWMEKQGWSSVPPRGDYEVLRLVKAGEKPVIIYQKLRSQEHVSIENSLVPLVKKFLREADQDDQDVFLTEEDVQFLKELARVTESKRLLDIVSKLEAV